jgi:phosphoserine phosphatase
MNQILLSAAFAAALFAGLLCCLCLGWRIGRRRTRVAGDDAQTGLGAIDGSVLALIGLLMASALFAVNVSAADALPSWEDGPAKSAITVFVEKVTTEGPDFVPPAERIAVFDNDGTLWSEQPLYFQAFFLFDRIRELAPDHPEWKDRQPFASVLEGDLESALAGGEHALLEMTMATHAGMTTDEFESKVKEWISTARHPETGKFFTEMVYQPMLELLDYLRTNGFKTFIVSGGGIEFLRPWAQEAYGIPPEQVIGSSIKTAYEVRDGKPVIVKLPEIHFIDDKAGKPAAIQHHIGRRPVFAAGNSDGDFEMLEWTTSGGGPRLGMLVHHDDGEREHAYDRKSHIGTLDKGLTEAPGKGWTIVSMRNDWKSIHPEKQHPGKSP